MKASIAYLKTVLGVDSFMLPLELASPDVELCDTAASEYAEGEPDSVSHLIKEGPEAAEFAIVVSSADFNEATALLLERMVAAMKQSFGNLLLLQLDENVSLEEAMGALAEHPRRAVLIFGRHTAELLSGGKALPLGQWLAPLPELPSLVTHGLSEIQSQPDLKKIVWQHLQMTMQLLG